MRYIGFDIMSVLLIAVAVWLVFQPYTNGLHYILMVILTFTSLGFQVCKEYCKSKDKQS